ncbi:MAG: ABC transporter permease [Anaerolineae bacterium]|nr:ABC transporter permease [Anaerolineae bacterium]
MKATPERNLNNHSENGLSTESKEKLNLLKADVIATRKVGRLERIIGKETYRILKGLVTTPTSIIGLVLIALFVIIALAAPIIAPPIPGTNPYSMPRDGYSAQPKPPMSEWKSGTPPIPFWYTALTGREEWVHLMGTSSNAYDIFYGVVWGTRTALKTGVIIEIATLIIGILVGSISAYYGGVVDNIIMRIVDIFMTLPFILAALILAAVLMPVLGRSTLPSVIALIVFGWMSYARLIRGDILAVKERDYVLAARVIGVRNSKILFKHIIPNAIFPTLVMASMDIGTYVLNFAALSFLGIGTEVGYSDWGQILSFARDWITQLGTYWYIVVYPGITLILFVLGWNLLGDAVRDVMDPRIRKMQEASSSSES